MVLVPPPIMGSGQSGGFQMMVEDRGSWGWPTGKATMEVVRAGIRPNRGWASHGHHLQRRSPQAHLDIDRTQGESLNIPLNNVFDTLQAYLGSSLSICSTSSIKYSRSTSRPTRGRLASRGYQEPCRQRRAFLFVKLDTRQQI